MTKLMSFARRSLVCLTIAGATTVVTAVPSYAQTDDHGCGRYAFSQCSHDASGRPTQVTVECYDQRYQECLDFYGG